METGLRTLWRFQVRVWIRFQPRPCLVVLFVVFWFVFRSWVCFSLELFLVSLCFVFAMAEVKPEMEWTWNFVKFQIIFWFWSCSRSLALCFCLRWCFGRVLFLFQSCFVLFLFSLSLSWCFVPLSGVELESKPNLEICKILGLVLVLIPPLFPFVVCPYCETKTRFRVG